MVLVQVTPPDLLPVSTDEIKAHLVLNDANLSPGDLPLLDQYLRAAVAEVDGRDGWLGRALVTQTWALKLDAFPHRDEAIELPLPPLQSVTSVAYVDPAGDPQTLASFQVAGVGWSMPSSIRPAVGDSWPSTKDQAEAVTITYVAGYGDAPASVPADIRASLMEAVADSFAYRETMVQGGSLRDVPTAKQRLARYRVNWV